MPQKTFTLALTIHAPVSAIQAYLTDITLLGQDHPLAITYTEMAPEILPDRPIRRTFRVTDRLKIGIFWITTTYRVTTSVQPDGSVVNEAFQSPGVHLRICYRLTTTLAGVQVTETTTVNGPIFLVNIAASQAQPAHATILQRLKTRLEAPDTAVLP